MRDDDEVIRLPEFLLNAQQEIRIEEVCIVVRFVGWDDHAKLALSGLISFFRRCRGEDPLRSIPQHFDSTSYVLQVREKELEEIHETLKRVLSLNEADKLGVQALADFERTFRMYLKRRNQK